MINHVMDDFDSYFSLLPSSDAEEMSSLSKIIDKDNNGSDDRCDAEKEYHDKLNEILLLSQSQQDDHQLIIAE